MEDPRRQLQRLTLSRWHCTHQPGMSYETRAASTPVYAAQGLPIAGWAKTNPIKTLLCVQNSQELGATDCGHPGKRPAQHEARTGMCACFRLDHRAAALPTHDPSFPRPGGLVISGARAPLAAGGGLGARHMRQKLEKQHDNSNHRPAASRWARTHFSTSASNVMPSRFIFFSNHAVVHLQSRSST